MTKEDKDVVEKGCFLAIGWIVFLLIGLLFGFIIGRYTKKCDTSLPVEEIVKVDSVTKANDSIKTKVKHLQNEKETKVKKVKNLNNDSTLKLFYELVSE